MAKHAKDAGSRRMPDLVMAQPSRKETSYRPDTLPRNTSSKRDSPSISLRPEAVTPPQGVDFPKAAVPSVTCG